MIGDQIEIDFWHTNPDGMPHVSWASEIVQLFGTSSVPAIVAGSVLGVFELGERFASQRAKDALSKWLVSFDVQKAKALPDGTKELFERIFGERHFSLKCFVRSAAFSIGAMAFIMILAFLINPKDVLDTVLAGGMFLGTGIGSWLAWSIIIDYIGLFKTRVILRIMTGTKLPHLIVAMAILITDFFVYSLIYLSGIDFVLLVGTEMYGLEFLVEFFDTFITSFGLINVIGLITQPSMVFLFVTFWAGFVPSLWMWLYVAALFVTRLLLRSERLVNWLRWFLDVDKTPFRSIGAVAAALAFIVSVAIILVSVEVSRISTAS